ncbi:hypothetical protein [Nonomuraea sp. NPDC049607]|uniref:hypothetical protein n=1 Tax=Nonomuraea sp. NPDC049607 TaxID=3154732 RepID=UPI00344A543C
MSPVRSLVLVGASLCAGGLAALVYFDSVSWMGPNSIEIRVGDGRTFPVALDPGSGRPRSTVALNC